MDIRWLKLAFLVVYKIIIVEGDLLESFRPREDDSPEVNEFLMNVLEHKDDFDLVRRVANTYQKMTKNARSSADFEPNYQHQNIYNAQNFDELYGDSLKRNAPIPHRGGYRKKKNKYMKKKHRFRRRLPIDIYSTDEEKEIRELTDQKKSLRDPVLNTFVDPKDNRNKRQRFKEVFVKPEGENGYVYVSENQYPKTKLERSAVHHTFRGNKANEIKNSRKTEDNENFYYVDLGEKAANEPEKRNNDQRWYPRPRYYYRAGSPQNINRPQEKFNYPVETEVLHDNLNNEVPFEKADSFEIEPNREALTGYNNPDGNNLYSVDAGPADNVRLINLQNGQNDEKPKDMTDERFFIDVNNNLRKSDNRIEALCTTSEISPVTEPVKETQEITESNGAKIIKQVGDGFIEITNGQKNEVENANMLKEPLRTQENNLPNQPNPEISNILPKNFLDFSKQRSVSVEPNGENAESYQLRKLQFIDDQMMNSEYKDDDYENTPKRSRRDFLDALGMKNEEEYSEDNSFKDIINENNTEIKNHTLYQNVTSVTCSPNDTIKSTPNYIQKENMKTIKQILEEPKESTESDDLGNFKNESGKKRTKKDLTAFQDFSENNERSVPNIKNLELKILQNKNRIYNIRKDNPKSRYDYYKPAKRDFRFQDHQPVNINKQIKESADFGDPVVKRDDLDSTNLLTTSSEEVLDFSTESSEVSTESTSETPNETATNSSYEQLAYQIDLENEKLAEVANGQLASKIVSTVFDQLREKTSLKNKFYPGLSRQHVNLKGTLDFDIFKANESEEVSEAQLFLDQLTKVLNKLVLNQVRRKMCQRLPEEIKQYLETMVNIKTCLPTNNFEPNTKQGDYLFTYEERKLEPPFDVKRLQQILLELEALLLNYHNLNTESQNRVEDVKDYIEKHVKMLKKVIENPNRHCDTANKKRNTKYNQDLIQKHVDSLGLGKKRAFVPNFNVNQIAKNRITNPEWKSYRKRDTKKKTYNNQSEKYKKLRMAAEKVREKREYERRIGEMFGGKQKKSLKKFQIDYEKPIVYSL